MFSGARQLTFIIRPRIGSDENIVHSGFVRTIFLAVYILFDKSDYKMLTLWIDYVARNHIISLLVESLKIETLQACRFCGLLVPQSETLISQPMRMINYKQLSLPMSPSTVCKRSIWSPSALISDACIHINISLTTSTWKSERGE